MLTLEDGSEYDQTGVISQAEANVSLTTGTFNVRATISNPNRLLMPGMFVRATVELGDEKAFLVPQRAVTFDADGKATVLVVSADNKAETHVLDASRSYGNSWVITDGLAEGDQIIVDGLQKISAGSEVTPLPVEIDNNGVIMQTITASPAPSDAAGGMPSGAEPSGTLPADSAPTGDKSEGSAQ
jgi:membrane fusion protein, multidrug efflux system